MPHDDATVRPHTLIGFTLLFFGFVLAARVLVLLFHQHALTARGLGRG